MGLIAIHRAELERPEREIIRKRQRIPGQEIRRRKEIALVDEVVEEYVRFAGDEDVVK